MLSSYFSRFAFIVLLGFSSIAASQSTNRATDYEQPFDDRFYIAPLASFGFFGSDYDSNGTLLSLDDEIGGQFSIGKPIFEFLNLELQGFYFGGVEESNTNTEADIYGYGGSFLLFPARRDFPIFFILGYNYGQYDFDGGKPNADIYDGGVGYAHKLNDYGVALRGEYRYRRVDLDGGNGFDADFNDHVVSLGLQIPLGAPPKAALPPKPAPTPVPGPRPKPVQPADSDGDGIPDNRDQCPGTPPGVQVTANGCPASKQAPIVLKGVTFEFNSAKLTSEATRRLDNVVNALSASRSFNVRVEGHTDSIGGAAYNLDLSQKRADSVKAYLTNHGISGNRLVTKGYGETQPVAPNTKPNGSDNPAGRAKNRRVELEVVK